MNKFEYKVVYVDFRGRVSCEGEGITIGPNERKTSFARRYLDSLGAQGWELVGINHLPIPQTSYFVFKRAAGSGEGSSTDSSQAGAQTHTPTSTTSSTGDPNVETI